MSRIKIDFPEKFLFDTEIPVRISDINYGGHLGNDAVLSVAHEARLRFLASIGYNEKNIESAAIIMTDAAIVYLSESFYGDVLLVSVGIGNFSNTGCDIFYKIIRKQDKKEIARIKTGIAFFDYSTKKLMEVPERFKKRF